jgi:dTMP kinase
VFLAGSVLREGRFITFEGGEGVGKSTQIRLLAESLRKHTREVVTTREPGGTPLAEKLRHVVLSGQARYLGPLGEALLFSAARIDHLDRVIRPALARGAFVLCDRFADSTRVYQGAKGGVEPALLATLEKVTLAGCAPNLTLILDLPVEIGLARAGARRGEAAADRFEGEELTFHQGLRQGFLAIAAKEPERCAVIDAALPIEKVAAAIWRVVEPQLKGGE